MPKFGTKNTLFWYFGAGIWKNYCHNWNQRPRICLTVKFGAKTKIFKFGTKKTLFGYFWARIWKQYDHIWNQRPRISLIAKFGAITKILKFETKNVWFGWFWVGILKNTIFIIEMRPLKFVHNFMQEWKFLNLGPVMSYFGIWKY